MIQIFLNCMLLVNQEFVELGQWILDFVLLVGFFTLFHHIFSPSNRSKYLEESLIPLNDDTPEEKLLFTKPEWQSKPKYKIDV